MRLIAGQKVGITFDPDSVHVFRINKLIVMGFILSEIVCTACSSTAVTTESTPATTYTTNRSDLPGVAGRISLSSGSPGMIRLIGIVEPTL